MHQEAIHITAIITVDLMMIKKNLKEVDRGKQENFMEKILFLFEIFNPS